MSAEDVGSVQCSAVQCCILLLECCVFRLLLSDRFSCVKRKVLTRTRHLLMGCCRLLFVRSPYAA